MNGNNLSIKSTPLLPRLRKIIVVVDDTINNRARDKQLPWKTQKNPEVSILNVDEPNDIDLYADVINNTPSLLTPNTTWLLDPYTLQYKQLLEDKIEGLLWDNVQRRIAILTLLVKNLGGKSIKINHIEHHILKGKLDAKANYKVADVHLSGKIENDIKQTYEEKIIFQEDGKKDIAAAEKLLLSRNASDDKELNTLIEKRTGINCTLTDEIKLTLNSSLIGSMELAVKLGLPGISNGGEIKGELEKIKNITVCWSMEFQKSC